jgi:hypothetical protein
MTDPVTTPALPYRVHLLRTVLASKMFGFATPEARDTFLESWTCMCEDADVSPPAEGTDYELEGPE